MENSDPNDLPEKKLSKEQLLPVLEQLRQNKNAAFNTKENLILLEGKDQQRSLFAAESIAKEAGLNLLRVDLSGIISGHVAEVEKNLGKLFSAADPSKAVVYFDEADALFGKRTAVKDAHDRYANIEINAFLKKLEEFGGIVVVNTRSRANIDTAFLRRLRFVVNLEQS